MDHNTLIRRTRRPQQVHLGGWTIPMLRSAHPSIQIECLQTNYANSSRSNQRACRLQLFDFIPANPPQLLTPNRNKTHPPSSILTASLLPSALNPLQVEQPMFSIIFFFQNSTTRMPPRSKVWCVREDAAANLRALALMPSCNQAR